MEAYQNCYGKFSAGGRKKSVVGIDRTHAIILPFDNDNIISVHYRLAGHNIARLNLRLVYINHLGSLHTLWFVRKYAYFLGSLHTP